MKSKRQELISLHLEKHIRLNLITDTLETCQYSESEIQSLIAFITNNDPNEKQIIDELVQIANRQILSRINKMLPTL